MKKPKATDAAYCIELRKMCKMGRRLDQEQMAFCDLMYNNYPEWYASTDKQVFNKTVPYGSNARRDD